MASLSIQLVNQPVSAKRTRDPGSEGFAVTLKVGADSLYMSREEAAHLAVDLLNAADATPADVEQVA